MATFSFKVCNGCFVHCLSSTAFRYNCLIFDLPCALISKQNFCVPLGFSASYRSLLFFRSLSIHLLGTTFASPAQTPARRTTAFGHISAQYNFFEDCILFPRCSFFYTFYFLHFLSQFLFFILRKIKYSSNVSVTCHYT